MPKQNYLKFKMETALKDTLYLMAADSGASLEYATGVTVGVVGALMANGHDYKQAIDVIACYMPDKPGARLAVPEAWLTDLQAALLARGTLFKKKEGNE